MTQRVFLALQPPSSFLSELEYEFREWSRKCSKIGTAREIPISNWHITLLFLDDQSQADQKIIWSCARQLAEAENWTELTFSALCTGPSSNSARLLWATTDFETSHKLGDIQFRLKQSLLENKIRFPEENRNFQGHITLARFRNPVSFSVPEQKIALGCHPESLDFLASELTPLGAEYSVLEKMNL